MFNISDKLLSADLSSSQEQDATMQHIYLRKKNTSSMQLWRIEAYYN
jgi:hypothetical protein